MRGVGRAFAQSVLSTAGIAVLLLVANFTLTFTFIVSNEEYARQDNHIRKVSEGLLSRANGHEHSAEVQEQMAEGGYVWGMLLDHEGNVTWRQALPEALDRHYTASDVARFSRWYLDDYPVDVWIRSDGLLVLGSEKDSVWKSSVKYPMPVFNRMIDLAKAAVVLNIVLALLLALLANLRQYRAIKRLAGGVNRLADNEASALLERGSFKDLAQKVNAASYTLQTQRAALNRRDSARTNWISGVSHDIRTPLSMILGYASEMADDTSLAESVRAKATSIQNQSLRIRALIADLNLASKMEYDMQPMKRATVQLGVLARRIVTERLNAALDNRYSIELDIHECSVVGDEALLARAISNLLQNAILHNPNGVHIIIRVDRVDNNARVQVLDDGVGVDAGTLRSLNTPNRTLSDSDAVSTRHGLGLLIVGQIARVHGGKTEYASMENSGLQATILLP